MVDYIGMTERANIIDRLDGLLGGRVWREKVPHGVILPRYDGLLLKPYLLVSFKTPRTAPTDRAIAGPEHDQPQILDVTTRVIGGHPDDVEAGNNAVVGLLRGWSPNAGTTSELKAYASGNGDVRERRYLPPLSFERVNWSCTINSAS